jgi:hypothetical protein
MKKFAIIAATLATASFGAFAVLAQQKSTLTIWVLTDIAPYFKEVSAEFEKANPDVSITIRDYPNEAYKTAIQVGVASNQPPDIFYNDPGEASFKFVRDGQNLGHAVHAAVKILLLQQRNFCHPEHQNPLEFQNAVKHLQDSESQRHHTDFVWQFRTLARHSLHDDPQSKSGW